MIKHKNETIIDIYEQVLNGERKTFPHYTWSPYKGGYDSFKRVVRYLILEKLKMNRKDIVKITNNFFTKWKLKGATSTLYNNVTAKAILYVFDDLNIKEWELVNTSKNFWKSEENVCEAVRWLINDRLKWSKEKTLSELTVEVFENNQLSTIFLKDHTTREYNKEELIKLAFPEWNVDENDFKIFLGSHLVSEERKNYRENQIEKLLKILKELPDWNKYLTDIQYKYLNEFLKNKCSVKETADMLKISEDGVGSMIFGGSTAHGIINKLTEIYENKDYKKRFNVTGKVSQKRLSQITQLLNIVSLNPNWEQHVTSRQALCVKEFLKNNCALTGTADKLNVSPQTLIGTIFGGGKNKGALNKIIEGTYKQL